MSIGDKIIKVILQSLHNQVNKNPPGLKQKNIKELLDENKQIKNPISKQRLSGIIFVLEVFGIIQKYVDTNYYQITPFGIKILEMIKTDINLSDILGSNIKDIK